MSDLKPLGGKSPLNLLPAGALRAVASVMEHGSVKYAPWNYTDNTQAQARIDELMGAMLRHTFKASDPTQSDFDDESGLHHLAHAGCCALIMLFKLDIDYEPSWFVRYPDLCAAWKAAKGPEAKAEALATIQGQARLDEPDNCRSTDHWIAGDAVVGAAPPEHEPVNVNELTENELQNPISIAISRLVKARFTLPQIEDLMAQARGESDGLVEDWPKTLDPVNMPRTRDPSWPARALTEREFAEAAKLDIVDSDLQRERCRHYWRIENGIKLPEGYTLYFNRKRCYFTIFDPDKQEVMHSLHQDEIEGPEWGVVYCEGKRCHWAGFQKELINVRYSNGRAYVCPDCGHLFKHLLPPNHFTGSDADVFISTVEHEDADAPLYELAAKIVTTTHQLGPAYDMDRDRLIQKVVDLLKKPRYMPMPGPQAEFFARSNDEPQ